MKNSKNGQIGKVSILFAVLVTVVICVFANFMWNLHRDDQKKQRIEAAERRQSEGPAQPVRGDVLRRQRNDAYSRLIVAIESHDNPTVQVIIDELLKLRGHIKELNRAAHHSVNKDNVFAFQALMVAGIECDALTPEGAELMVTVAHRGSEAFLVQLLEGDCGLHEQPIKSRLLELVLRSKNPEHVFLLDEDESVIELYPRLIEALIRKKRPKEAIALIARGVDPNTAYRDSSRQILELSIEKELPEVALALINNGADVTIKIEKQVPRYALEQALAANLPQVVRAILKRDPEHIVKASLSKKLFDRLLSNNGALLSKEWVELLVDSGATMNKAKRTDFRLLLAAVRKSDYALVEFLLAHGVDPNVLLLKSTLLGEAKNIKGGEGEKIVTLLENHGALDDVLAQARSRRGIDENAACTIGKKITLSGFDRLQEQIVEYRADKGIAAPAKTIQLCEQGIVYCRDQGAGVDDCMRSIPTCRSGDSDEITICCEAAIRETYFSGRCAGLSVKETVMWQDEFETAYGIPSNF